ncbi:MarR family transcriptional regulator [Amycolatopsis endophytica]|uniref:DNA-binding MarR family transcriptional regulator n=1 Tax=Amycolatopsis endophytica TaxID=860233 RepID=A0A853BFH8_9PSEU|nr:MarR family transcriptional regulator [Amycolatopsis endophytica]NYI93256.1 DNA-binding MarR family transcriptional regulator [Amycolatopsis endophytica]
MVRSQPRVAADRALCGLVNGLASQIGAHMRHCAGKLGLTAAQGTALRELTGPMSMGELAERMSCEPSNATVVVDKLERRALIERCPHPTDRRAKRLVLTADGAALREQLLDLLSEESPLAALSEPEQRALQALLERAVTKR